MFPIKSRHHYLRIILNQLKNNKNLASVYIEVWVGGGVPYVPSITTYLYIYFDRKKQLHRATPFSFASFLKEVKFIN